MKSLLKTALLMLAICAVMGAVAPAHATHIEDFTGTADCDGWQVGGVVRFRSSPVNVTLADLHYTVVLSQGGNPVETHQATVTITRTSLYTPFALALPWTVDLCGDYTVHGELNLTTDQYPADNSDPRNFVEFHAEFACECPPPPPGACHYTPGFWKNHAHLWPVESLTLGAITYTKAQLLAIMGTPVRGDATIILAYHLIAAKLNVANGADGSIQSTIDSADAFLTAHPVGSNPRNPARAQGLALKDVLADFNEMGCPDGASNALKSFDEGDEGPALNWGDIKSLFR